MTLERLVNGFEVGEGERGGSEMERTGVLKGGERWGGEGGLGIRHAVVEAEGFSAKISSRVGCCCGCLYATDEGGDGHGEGGRVRKAGNLGLELGGDLSRGQRLFMHGH